MHGPNSWGRGGIKQALRRIVNNQFDGIGVDLLEPLAIKIAHVLPNEANQLLVAIMMINQLNRVQIATRSIARCVELKEVVSHIYEAFVLVPNGLRREIKD